MKRRAFLGLTLATAFILAGCGDQEGKKNYLPAVIGPHDRCTLCGMVILHYDGPKAEVFIKDVEQSVKFCSVRDAFTFALQPENQRRLRAFFVTDMAHSAWDKPQESRFVAAADAVYVYGSSREGAMGVEPVPFSDQAKAQAFMAKFGGRLVPYDAVTLKMLDQN